MTIDVIPIAQNKWWDRTERKFIYGNVFLWEIKLGQQTWYLYRDKYRWWSSLYEFPYKGVSDSCTVHRFGHFHLWKGTYKD